MPVSVRRWRMLKAEGQEIQDRRRTVESAGRRRDGVMYAIVTPLSFLRQARKFFQETSRLAPTLCRGARRSAKRPVSSTPGSCTP